MALAFGLQRLTAAWRSLAWPVAILMFACALPSVLHSFAQLPPVIEAAGIVFATSLVMSRAAKTAAPPSLKAWRKGARRDVARAGLLPVMLLFHYLAAIASGIMALVALLPPVSSPHGIVGSVIIVMLLFAGALYVLARTLPAIIGALVGMSAPGRTSRRDQGHQGHTGKYALLIYAALTPVFFWFEIMRAGFFGHGPLSWMTGGLVIGFSAALLATTFAALALRVPPPHRSAFRQMGDCRIR